MISWWQWCIWLWERPWSAWCFWHIPWWLSIGCRVHEDLQLRILIAHDILMWMFLLRHIWHFLFFLLRLHFQYHSVLFFLQWISSPLSSKLVKTLLLYLLMKNFQGEWEDGLVIQTFLPVAKIANAFCFGRKLNQCIAMSPRVRFVCLMLKLIYRCFHCIWDWIHFCWQKV